ncbi:uncharacterized protein LOC131684905 [Topomyia yanbarensis]|uniref:uncharacterized protein LOC131684905 n=1 Tax=Topomyia yanbarensis TaxID=2498891 RepID=UPI00273B1879|nr:uncharacterized protein LOC131684905 [Topomyia yanbarensis]XP_058824137.1 uncharacterized protein LOC131684905 [Topomyia yanbarensis]
MGLFGWIKKDTNLHRRRESAPPVTKNITESGASANRDQAYIDKLNKFNEWRAKQRLERISEGCTLVSPDRRIPSVIEEEKDSEGGEVSDFSSDIDINSEERRVLNRRLDIPKSPRYTRHRQDAGVPKKPKRSVEFYRNINRIPENGEHSLNNGKNNNVHERFSLPSVMASATPGRIKFNVSKTNNNTIYENEREEFEQMRTNDTIGDTYAVESPPSRFYKENSSPYSKNSLACRTSPAVVDSTSKKAVNLLQKSARSRSFKDKPAPPPPMPSSDPPVLVEKKHNRTIGSGSESPFAGSYRKYDLNSSSIYDEHIISSRAYRGDMKPLNSTANSPASKERRKSPSYQTVINKHGDLVDYALPFSDTTDTQSELNCTNDIRACEEVINENFRFLNSDIQRSTVVIDDSTSMIHEPISVLKERAPQIVTDLDRSNQSTVKGEEVGLFDEVDLVIHEPQDILLELDSLEKWSKSIQLSDDFLQKQFTEKGLLEYFQRSSSQLLICWPKEVHYRVGALRSSFMAPLEFSCGMFRNTPVTLRKYSLSVERSLYFAEEACKKDFELLNQIKHYAIATLMAVCYDAGLNQATLVFEPFDFTLFDYIHKMNKRLSLLHAITVVQQISLAVSYLQECGYIHSNISSGCILMRRYPYTVKLTSFELTTEASDSIRKEIEERYGSTSSSRNSMTSSQHEELKKITTYSRLIKNDEQFLRDKYRKLSKQVSESRKGQISPLGDTGAYDCRTSRYLPYCKEYREKFSLFYYVAPELLVPKSNFVFPSKNTDVYSLTLLLWEILNGYVPFVVYSRQELEKLQASASLQLPMFEKERCDRFRQVFENGLAYLNGRKLTVTDILDTLECLLIENGLNKNFQANEFAEDYEEQLNASEIRKKNELNDIRKQNAMEKTDKIYFQSTNTQPDYVNKTTNGSADSAVPKRTKPQPKKPSRKINKTPVQKEAVDESKPKKSPFGSSFNLSHSAIYQSIFDFNNKFLSPRSSKQVVYGRTSTVKKHKKPDRSSKRAAKELFEPTTFDNQTGSFHRLSTTESDNNPDKVPIANIQQTKQNEPETIGPLEVYCKESPAKTNINSEKSKFLKEIIVDEPPAYDCTNENQQAVSCDSSPGTKRKSLCSKLSNSMRFTIGDFTLPDTPIARKNKIRKHAWLSDQKLVISDENTSTPVSPQGRRTCSFFNDLSSQVGRDSRSHGGLSNPLNLNISSSMQEIKPRRINISVNVIRTPEMGEKLKAHSQEFNKTTPTIVDIDLDEPAAREVNNKAESVHNVFEGTLWKKEKEICERSKLHHSADSLDEGQADTSATVITAHLTSVRDAIRKIETTFEDTGYDYSPNRKLDCSKKPPEGKVISEESVVVEENLLIPTKVLELEKTIEQHPLESEPPRAVTRLDVVLTNNTLNKKEELLQYQQQTVLPETPVFNPNSQLFIRRKANNAASVIQRTVYRESIVSSSDLPGLDTTNTSQASSTALPAGSARKKKLTTRVTVNMRKISRRASDIGTSPASSRPSSLNLDEDLPPSGCLTPTNGTAPVRHSCGNDLLKAFTKLRLVQSNEESGGSRSVSVNEDRGVERRSMCTPVKSTGSGRTEKFVCCNCGSSMVPADSLNVPTGSRIGVSAAFGDLNFPRESLASMFEDNLGFIQQPVPGTPMSRQALAAIPNAKSTEDLYIDDDFYQGLNLGANMELVEFIDDGHYLDEFGYDIYTTEEIYDAEELEENAGQEPIGNGDPKEEEQFLFKCANLNPTSTEEIGSVFSPTQPEEELKQLGQEDMDK